MTPLSPPLTNYLEKIAHPLLQRDEERELLVQAKEGNLAARNKLVEHNLLLAVSVARRYFGRTMSKDDVVQEANQGLFAAIDHFDLAYDVKFSTYASFWVRQRIQESFRHNTLVHIPAYAHDLMKKWAVEKTRLSAEQDREVTDDEVTASLNLSPGNKQTVGYAAAARDVYDYPPDMNYEATDLLEAEDDHKFLMANLQKLTEREQYILTRLFGIDCEQETMVDIAAHLGVTRQAIYNAKEIALRKLREQMSQKSPS